MLKAQSEKGSSDIKWSAFFPHILGVFLKSDPVPNLKKKKKDNNDLFQAEVIQTLTLLLNIITNSFLVLWCQIIDPSIEEVCLKWWLVRGYVNVGH